MRFLSACLVLALTSVSAPAQDPLSARRLLERSIAYHDPGGVWGKRPLELVFEESRPDGSTRRTEVTIDLPGELFTWSSRQQGHDLTGRLDGERCTVALDGRTEITPEEEQTYRLSCERLVRRRNYYTYLWGLPMKLRDPGTRIDPEVIDTEFGGREALGLRVTYDEAVGSDTWYVYFDPETAALAGYRFFHDESANDGEYITLEGEARVGGLRLPKNRAWYTHQEDRYLGTDTLLEGRER